MGARKCAARRLFSSGLESILKLLIAKDFLAGVETTQEQCTHRTPARVYMRTNLPRRVQTPTPTYEPFDSSAPNHHDLSRAEMFIHQCRLDYFSQVELTYLGDASAHNSFT